ncbi:hypothetical protein EV189_2981 [Motilibacter rhizosphaerae]|uniref:DUF1684 domain-containing protein n=1 Tax=Motilibacter rhizosphaerae TaxID=598652 RepID=A0A4Q7NSB5_9ACTN|nr:DUF1684 domain-containing protein [Motilibacter rhizosphaerae]RZS87550.1 hypothetical protein EV189_2981 [Motilibacter rhizosphaerae]
MDELTLLDWRRRVSELYAAVRAEPVPERAHRLWRAGRDDLLRTHAQSPLPPDSPLRETGVPCWDYDPAVRFELPVVPVEDGVVRRVPTGDVTIVQRLVGRVDLPEPVGGSLGVWELQQYAQGIFVPLRDATAGTTTYGAGRYLLDTAKSADLGGTADTLVIDLNFAYHPSCRYDSRWVCPLAAAENRLERPVQAGERLAW